MASISNLPLPLDSLVGRQVQIAEVARLLSTTRLLTLAGVGGSGKTRLALAVADEVAQAYAEGAWFVELAPLSDPKLVPRSLAQVLALQETPARPLVEDLVEYLRPRALLLVLDNCEHLALAAAHMAETLLRTCPHLQILCTSREPLGVAGEVTYQVPVLPVPDPHYLPATTAGYLQSAAVQLFVERATSAQPSFVLTEQNAAAVAVICQRLDGIPLAIELAASRVRTLSVKEIAARLTGSLSWLRSGERTAPLRHQTLQAALDWSYALLTPAEQALLGQLSVFAGGWTLAAADAVCQQREAPVLDLLSRLVDKSLVVPNLTQEHTSRYHLLEPVRQYARDHLLASSGLLEARDRHLCFYIEWAEAVEPKLHGPHQVSWLSNLEADFDNLRAAFAWALERDCSSPLDELCDAPLRLASALPSFWRMHSRVAEGRQWLAAALECCEAAPTLLRASALEQAAWLANDQNDFGEAPRLAEQSLALFRSVHDEWGVARSLYHLALVAAHCHEFARAQALTDESRRLWQDMGYSEGVALSFERMGLISLQQGEYGRARQMLEQAVVFWRELGHLWGLAWSPTFAGLAACRLGDYGSARAYLTESRPIWQALGDQHGLAVSAEILAEVDQSTGDLASARAGYLEALALFQRVGNKWSIAECLQKLATVACAQRRWEQAARLFGAGDALHEAILVPAAATDRADFDRNIRMTREALGAKRFAAAWQDGQVMTAAGAIADAVAYASAQAEPAKAAAQTPLQAAKVPFGGLTARERQVAALVAQGRSNREIAEALVVTERTVAVHVSNVLAKLGFNSRTQIATWAMTKGLVQ